MNNVNSEEYRQQMDRALNFPSFVLVTTGRTGSDFLQSLLDSHTEVLTFNGIFSFYGFWNRAKVLKSTDPNVIDLFSEMYGFYIDKFKSRYDLVERKDQLGDTADQQIDIDSSSFVNSACRFMAGREINSRNVLLATYLSYACCLDQDINKKRMLFHHAHHHATIDPFIKDFPESKIVSMTRDPRANYYSSMAHRDRIGTISVAKIYSLTSRLFMDVKLLEKYNNDYLSIRVEDLGQKCILEELCQWLSINYEEVLLRSTWGGLQWRGDRVSVGNDDKVFGFSKKMLENDWEKKLGWSEKYLLNMLLNKRLVEYHYKNKRISIKDYFLAPICIPLPLKFERRLFNYKYIYYRTKSSGISAVKNDLLAYAKRIKLFYIFYIFELFGKKAKINYLKCS